MKANEVPQDDANIFEGKTKDIQYALDENGNYTVVKSLGWTPKNEVMQHAWDVEIERINEARELVLNKEKSPIYFHMINNLMDIKLLAAYTGFNRFSTKRHMKPSVFEKLSGEKIKKYLEAFGMKTRDELYTYECKGK